jgi:NAD(P)-dependent dehydrogenase (short-subunit alcohol dehydrogenase family)
MYPKVLLTLKPKEEGTNLAHWSGKGSVLTETSIKGKVTMVSGAGSGLGEATPRVLGEAGAAVACFDVNGAAAESVHQRLKESGVNSMVYQGDVASADCVARTVHSVVQQFGRLDVVVNSAAIDHTVSVDEMTVQ